MFIGITQSKAKEAGPDVILVDPKIHLSSGPDVEWSSPKHCLFGFIPARIAGFQWFEIRTR